MSVRRGSAIGAGVFRSPRSGSIEMATPAPATRVATIAGDMETACREGRGEDALGPFAETDAEVSTAVEALRTRYSQAI